MILLPKDSNANSIDMFRPITLEKFKFKILSIILVDRFASIMPLSIFKEQKGFVQVDASGTTLALL